MRTFLRIFCVIAAITLCAGCSCHSKSKHPVNYQGGQYYGDALHAGDLKSQ